MCSLVLCMSGVPYDFLFCFAAVISGESGQSIPLQQSVSFHKHLNSFRI